MRSTAARLGKLDWSSPTVSPNASSSGAPDRAGSVADGQDPRINDPSLGDAVSLNCPQARCQSLMRDYDKFPRNLLSQIKICLREICLGFQQNPDLGQLFQIQKYISFI